jgi:ribosomal-protein-alanine N-acetyltransferase
MNIEIKKMIETDIDHVHEIESAVFAEPWSKKAFLSDLNNDYAIPMVIRLENKIAGYTCLYHVLDEIQIGNLAVSPHYHKRGIGTKIMEHIMQMAVDLKVKILVLEVRPSNEAARRLYLKFGFKEIGHRRFYYRKPTEDALIMIKGIE